MRNHACSFVFAAALLAATLYNAWILGYWLNPRVGTVARASDLASPGQPYNWLFFTTDLLCGLIILFVTWRLHARRPLRRPASRLAFWLAVFAISTIAGASSSPPCVSAYQTCPTFIHAPITVFHALASVLAGLALSLALLVVRKIQPNFWLTGLTVAYTTSGVWTGIEELIPGTDTIAQHCFLLVSGVAIVAGLLCLADVAPTKADPGNAD